MERLAREGFSRVTPDCDGPVSGTGRHAEGTATGFNRKGRVHAATPSYAPSPGPVRSLTSIIVPGTSTTPTEADILINHRIGQVRPCLPHARIETRIDSAFPDETVVRQLHSSEAEFTASVPFERFPALKGLVESKKRWCRPADGIDCFETRWKPKSRNARRRLIPTGNQVGRQLRSPFRIGPFRLIGSGAHSGSSPPTGEWARVRSLPSMRAGGRRSVSLPGPGRIAERIAYRSGDPDRQPTAHVRRHPRPQPHPRAPDPDRCPRPRHTPKRAAVRHFRGTETLRRTPVRCTGRIIRPGGKPIPSMNGHDGRDGEHPTYPSIPNTTA